MTARLEDACGLENKVFWGTEMVSGNAAGDQIEGVVRVRKLFRRVKSGFNLQMAL